MCEHIVQPQHTPLLATTLEAVGRGRLPHADYPDVKGAPDHAAINGTSAKVHRSSLNHL